MEAQPRVLAAVVTYNSGKVIDECLDSLEMLTESGVCDFEAVIVDNCSSDATREILRRRTGNLGDLCLRSVESAENLGWGGGNNLAIHSATRKPDYVLLCNPDASIDPGGLSALLRAMAAHPTAGIVVPQLDQGGEVSLGAFPERGPMTLLLGDLISGRLSRRLFRRKYRHRQGVFPIRHGYAGGGLMLIRYSALERAGFFDERIFLTSDDIDISRSIRRVGWRILGCNDAVGRHLVGTGSRVIGEDVVGSTRNRLALESEIVFVEKWYGRRAARLFARYRAGPYYPMRDAVRRAARRPVEPSSELRGAARAYLADQGAEV